MRLSSLSQVRSAITGKNRFPVTIRQIQAKLGVLSLVYDTHPTTTELLNDAVMRDGLAEHLQECYGVRIGMSMHGFIAASRIPPWLPSGWGCRDQRLSRV